MELHEIENVASKIHRIRVVEEFNEKLVKRHKIESEC